VDDPRAEDTGLGTPPIVDMGAFEFGVLCSADVDGNGSVDAQDLVAVLIAWGRSGGSGDVNGDGAVGIEDLIAVLLAWGPCA
jgi:hypothetical protein